MTYNEAMRKILGFVILVLIFQGCTSGDGEGESPLPGEPGKVFKSGMTLKYTDRGRKVWEIFADSLSQSEDETAYVYAKAVEISFYGETGTIENTVKADNAKVDLSTNDVVLTDNVVLRNVKKGITAYTEILNYSASLQRVYSESPVKIERNGGFVEGTGMEMDLSTNEISIKEPHGRN